MGAVGLLVVAGVAITGIVSANVAASTSSARTATPADDFIQSVVTRDGSTGWQQLCPAVQRQVSETTVVQQAAAQSASEKADGLQLSARFLDSTPGGQGTATRVYQLTAQWPDGQTASSTYAVRVASSGCVLDVQHS
jgi:hypothetical protein